jgi:hypothetical protein
VLNYHLNVFKGEKIYLQLDNFRDKMAVQVGDAACNEFVMKPEIDLPDVSLIVVKRPKTAANACEISHTLGKGHPVDLCWP